MAKTTQPTIGARRADGLVRDITTGDLSDISETARLDASLGAIKAAATPAWQCGGAIHLSPARGAVQRLTPVELVPDADGGTRLVNSGYRGRDGARVRDVFDRMVDQARRAHQTKGDKAGVFEPPFTWAQVQAARDYSALTERCAASGVKCSSLESLSGSGSGGGREEAIFDDLARLRALHRRIGTGLAKQLRRHRPSTSSSGPDPRKSITARYLVDQVCLSGRTPKEILSGAGWTADGRQIKGLRDALCSALDRMQGFKSDRPQNMG